MRIRLRFGIILFMIFWGCGGSGGAGTGAPADTSGQGFHPSDPERAGPFALSSYGANFDVPEFGAYQGRIYYPLSSPDEPAPAGYPGAPYPSVLLTNGLATMANMLSWLSEHLASHGYVVLAFTPHNPFSMDVSAWGHGFHYGPDLLAAENSRAASPVFGSIDMASIGIIGLSFGGAGVIEAAGTSDIPIKAVVALAPQYIELLGETVFADPGAAAARISAPTQIQIGSQDCMVHPQEGSFMYNLRVDGKGVMNYYEVIPAVKLYLEIFGANHVSYVNEIFAETGSAFVAGMRMDCHLEIAVSEQHRICAKYATMWFDTYLYGTEYWEAALFGAGIARDLEAGTLSDFRIN